MHKFYWRNTHGPGARRGDTGDSVQHYRLGKSGSADNILSEGSSSNSFNSSQTGSDDIFERTHHHSGPFLNTKRTEGHQGSNTLVARIRRMSGRNCRPKSVADMDELTKNLQNIKMTNSQAQEYNSIEHLEAAQYAGGVTSASSAPRHAPSYAQVRNSRSLYFSAEAKSRTWNQQDARQFRAQECHPAHQAHRLSVSSFRYDDTGPGGPGDVSTLPQQGRHGASSHGSGLKSRRLREKVQRSLSCERSRHARQMAVKTFKISSDKIQDNLTKLSSNINNKLDQNGRLSTLNCIGNPENESSDKQFGDWYKPSRTSTKTGDNELDDDLDDDVSAGFLSLSSCTASSESQETHPSNSHSLNFNDIKSPSLSVFSCTEPQEDLTSRRLSHTMRGKMHSANKKISMIRSKSMERFSKKQELIVVTPRIKTVEAEQAEQFSGPFIGQAIAVTDFTPNPYDREALRLRRGDIIDVIETNPNGTWRGHCRGRVGNFKFLNVETIPNGRMRLSSISIQGDPQCREDRGAKTRSVHQLLASVNMTQYLSVLTLNGFDNIDSLYKLDKATLDYFGIVNPVQQSQLLGAIQDLLNAQSFTERDSGCYSSLGTETSSESGCHEEREAEETGERGRVARSRSCRALRLNNAVMELQGL